LKHERIVYDLHLRRYKRYVNTTEANGASAHRASQNQSNEESKSETSSSTTNNSGPSATRTPKPPSAIYSRYSWIHRQSVSKQNNESDNEVKDRQSSKIENSAIPGSTSSSACIIM
jgi:hypothetical protein